ncbi:MAG: FlgD immunoglobulin-like domain containing protein, partial [Thermoleophilia bacterium]|nr:FlgD immunoglobulin-like domain containing protein [Thermoleophilia bacterium]
ETKTLERALAALAPVGSERQTMPRPPGERASYATRDGSTCGYQHAELFARVPRIAERRGVTRLPQLLVVLALLGATAAAFAVTERLKLERSPITGTRVDKVFSPVCECARDVAEISFVLRQGTRVTIDLLDRRGEPVRTLVSERPERAGRVAYIWDGRDDAGEVVPEGIYRPRVQLRRHGWTIVLPNPIRVDTTAPTIRALGVFPRVFSPDGDGRRDRVSARYAIDEPAWAMLLVDGRRRVMDRYRRTEGRLVWYGRVRGRPVRPGRYELRLRAVDRAGNRSRSTRPAVVRVRYVELSRERIEVAVGRRFSVRVSTDARSYRWRLAGRTGQEARRVLVLRAPAAPGEYRLTVVVGSRGARAAVVVTERPLQSE